MFKISWKISTALQSYLEYILLKLIPGNKRKIYFDNFEGAKKPYQNLLMDGNMKIHMGWSWINSTVELRLFQSWEQSFWVRMGAEEPHPTHN